MESIKDITKSKFPLKEVGERECELCGNVFKLYETIRGVLGACKPCSDKQLAISLNLPKLDDLRGEKLSSFIRCYEKVSSDLENVSVRSYKTGHHSQLKAKQLIIDYINGFDKVKSLVFSGNPGVGKSHLSYATVKALRTKGYMTMFIKSTQLLEMFRASYGNSGISEKQIFDVIEQLDLLALDDIGSEYVKSNENGHETWASDILYKIFDMRMEKATICSTNYIESELQLKYGNNGPRIISRMLNKATGIRLEGEDYRRQEVF